MRKQRDRRRSESPRVPDARRPDVNGLTWQKRSHRDRIAVRHYQPPSMLRLSLFCWAPTWAPRGYGGLINAQRARKITKRRFMVPRRRPRRRDDSIYNCAETERRHALDGARCREMHLSSLDSLGNYESRGIEQTGTNTRGVSNNDIRIITICALDTGSKIASCCGARTRRARNIIG